MIRSSLPCSIFVGVSVDGFLARPDGSVDLLKASEGVPHGFDEFYASIDAVVNGRNTFEWVVSWGQWAYGDHRVASLSTRPLGFSVDPEARVEQMSGEPADIIARLAAAGSNRRSRDR